LRELGKKNVFNNPQKYLLFFMPPPPPSFKTTSTIVKIGENTVGVYRSKASKSRTRKYEYKS
jgi:hypothetical protein